MIKQIIYLQENNVYLNLPTSFVGKKVVVIAFTLEEESEASQLIEEMPLSGSKEKNLLNGTKKTNEQTVMFFKSLIDEYNQVEEEEINVEQIYKNRQTQYERNIKFD